MICIVQLAPFPMSYIRPPTHMPHIPIGSIAKKKERKKFLSSVRREIKPFFLTTSTKGYLFIPFRPLTFLTRGICQAYKRGNADSSITTTRCRSQRVISCGSSPFLTGDSKDKPRKGERGQFECGSPGGKEVP